MKYSFSFSTFGYLIIAFFFTVIIGTLSHEMGHFLAAKLLGFSAELHYQSTSYSIPNNIEISQFQQIILTSGGPIQTIFVGTFGYLLLIFLNKRQITFSKIHWLAVLLSFFWSREVFNLLWGFISAILNNTTDYFGGDEAIISELFNLPLFVVTTIMGIIACIILIDIIFNRIPKEFRFEFILSGIIGCFLGFYLWMYHIGPTILP